MYTLACGAVAIGPLLGGGVGCTSWRIGCGDVAGDVVPLLGAMVRCHGKVPLLDAMW